MLLACNKIKTINPTYYVQSTKCDAEFVHSIYDFELQLQRKITYEFAQPYQVSRSKKIRSKLIHRPLIGQKCTQAILINVA